MSKELAKAIKAYTEEFNKRLAVLDEFRDVERRLRNADRYVANALLKVRIAAEKKTNGE